MFFKRKSPPSMPQVKTATEEPSSRRRLSNLQRASARIANQLENPRLTGDDRPRVERKLASIRDEIAELQEIV